MDERDGAKAEEVAHRLLLATVGEDAAWDWEDVGDDEHGPVYVVRLASTTARLRMGITGEWPGEEPYPTLSAFGKDDNEVTIGTGDNVNEVDLLWQEVNWKLRGERVVNDLLEDLNGRH